MGSEVGGGVPGNGACVASCVTGGAVAGAGVASPEKYNSSFYLSSCYLLKIVSSDNWIAKRTYQSTAQWKKLVHLVG